jgi:putative membrane protein
MPSPLPLQVPAVPLPVAAEPAPLWRLLLDATLFGIAGIVLLIIGYYVWELITPYNLRHEIHENKNVAVAIVVAAFILGMAIVIAASLILIK